jgi:hypothetical protein
MQLITKQGNSRVHIMLLGQHIIDFLSVVWRESVFNFHPYHYFQIIFTMHMCDQSHEPQTAGPSKWYAVKQIHVITEV